MSFLFRLSSIIIYVGGILGFLLFSDQIEGENSFLVKLLIALAIFFLGSQFNKIARRQKIKEQFGSESEAKILKRTFWVGQSSEELIASLGKPNTIDKKVYKSKVKEVWRYFPSKKNSSDLKITLENDSVVGWHKKE